MGAYDVIKDAVSLAQKVDNIDLMRQLLDLQKECLICKRKFSSIKSKLLI